ncbi:hypothetical protein [Burkholderia thailandensis]|uniref:hypothetical protein n=1 Tax=Burkholderia thailandensis TaxID=57975 RepID=UPI000FD6B062|nr:hypothetical protein [Burkholderia thailandensis]
MIAIELPPFVWLVYFMVIRNMKAYRNYWNRFVKIVVNGDSDVTNAGAATRPGADRAARGER